MTTMTTPVTDVANPARRRVCLHNNNKDDDDDDAKALSSSSPLLLSTLTAALSLLSPRGHHGTRERT
jgi:hypothetical protein